MNNSNQEINKQIKKEQNVVENACKLYYEMRLGNTNQKPPEQEAKEAWKRPYLERWHAVNKMELERIRREGV